MLALTATTLIALPTGMAAAQQLPPLPQPPPVDGCAADPTSCLPDAPELDPCLEDPQSCLPEPPPVDECVQNPASCLPEPPPVDECVQNPESCLPEGQDADRCVEAPQSCLPEALGGGDPAKDEERAESDEDELAAAPLKGQDPPGGSKGGSGPPRPGRDLMPAEPRPRSAGTNLRERPASGPAAVPDGGLLDRIGRGLTDAAQRFAFPLAVAGLVAAFVLVQGRIDRRDPKLAAAPINSRHDVVEFR